MANDFSRCCGPRTTVWLTSHSPLNPLHWFAMSAPNLVLEPLFPPLDKGDGIKRGYCTAQVPSLCLPARGFCPCKVTLPAKLSCMANNFSRCCGPRSTAWLTSHILPQRTSIPSRLPFFPPIFLPLQNSPFSAHWWHFGLEYILCSQIAFL